MVEAILRSPIMDLLSLNMADMEDLHRNKATADHLHKDTHLTEDIREPYSDAMMCARADESSGPSKVTPDTHRSNRLQVQDTTEG